MIGYLKSIYRSLKEKNKFFWSVNWIKTYYFNYKMFPYSIGKKLPVYFYGRVKFSSLKGKITIDAPIKKAMIGFGQPYEWNTRSNGTAELILNGEFVFKGHVQFGMDYFIFIDEEGHCEFGHLSSLGSRGKLLCKEKIILGDFARIGSESQLIDTNFHQMVDTITGEKYKMTAPILIGNYNYISNRVSIMQNTITPNNCTIASNTLCNNDYSSLGEHIIIGGIPAKLLKENISRDWKGEQGMLEKYLVVYK